MRDFLIEYDANRQNSGIPLQSSYINNYVLTSDVEKIISVPVGADLVLFASTGNFYCRFDGTVVYPTVDITNGSGGELNPSGRALSGISTIHLIAHSNIIVTLAFYNVPKPVAVS